MDYSLLSFVLPVVTLTVLISSIALARSNRALAEIAAMKEGGVLARTKSKEDVSPLVAVPSGEQTEISQMAESTQPETVELAPMQEESGFFVWLKEDWLLKLGGALVLMGVLFFLSVAFMMVGPQGKIVLGLLLGICLMAFGFRFAQKYIVGGASIHVTGAIVVLITASVAQTPSYNVIDGFMAMLLMFCTASMVALMAFAYKRESLAHAGLLLASSVPLLIPYSFTNFFDVLLYLALVIIGVLLLAIVTQWRMLVLVSQAVLCIYSISFSVGLAALSSNEVLMVVVFGFLFFITSVFSILRSQGATGRVDGWIALLNAVYVLGWVFVKVPHEWQAMLLAGVAFLYLVAFFAVYKITEEQTPFIVYGGVSLGLLVAAVMLQLSGPAETIALLLLTSGATVMAHYLSKKEGIAEAVAFTNLLPLVGILTSVYHIQSYSEVVARGVDGTAMSYGIWQDFTVVIGAMIVYALLGIYFKGKGESIKVVAWFVSGVLGIITIWQVLHILIPTTVATLVSLLIYTAIGLSTLSRGVTTKDTETVKLGRIILGLVALRVLFIDAWSLGNTTVGILICIVIGLLLLSSSLITKKLTTNA